MMNKEIGVYIHIPFCKSKCKYCDFNSFINREEDFYLYKNAVINEINLFSEIKNCEIKTIFLGGGTPTIFPVKFIEEILENIFKYNVKKDAEITIEANPGTLKLDVIRELKNININRISVGLQAWQNKILKKLGRIHTVEEFLKNYNDIVKVGFNNINIDLMFSLPDQTFEDWEYTLNNVVNLRPKHISAYSLIIEDNTEFFDLYKNGKLKLPNDNIDRKMYYYLKNFLIDNGYTQYELSNFAFSGYECKHNMIYWTLYDYKGFGLGAHSLWNGFRISNIASLERYIYFNGDVDKILEIKNKLSQKDKIEEFMFLGLRLNNGILKSDFKNKFMIDIELIYDKVIEKNVKNGFLISNERLYLSEKGKDFANIVMSDFLL